MVLLVLKPGGGGAWLPLKFEAALRVDEFAYPLCYGFFLLPFCHFANMLKRILRLGLEWEIMISDLVK